MPTLRKYSPQSSLPSRLKITGELKKGKEKGNALAYIKALRLSGYPQHLLRYDTFWRFFWQLVSSVPYK